MQDPGRRMPRALVLEIAVQIGVEQLESCQLLGLEAKRHGILVALGPRGGEPNSTYGPFIEFMIGRHDVPSVCVLRCRGCAGCIIERDLRRDSIEEARWLGCDSFVEDATESQTLQFKDPLMGRVSHALCQFLAVGKAAGSLDPLCPVVVAILEERLRVVKRLPEALKVEQRAFLGVVQHRL